MEIELYDLINTLFESHPKEEKTYNISFSGINLKQSFEALLTIFTKGIKTKYEDKDGNVNLSLLGQSQIEHIQKYFLSIGFTFHFNILNDSNENRLYSQRIKYSNIEIKESTRLSDLFLPLLSRGKIYLINFNYI
tara:strand:+ start:115 stop:519 length:405 start_codon:yes stop_codon:yes gene_type:complete